MTPVSGSYRTRRHRAVARVMGWFGRHFGAPDPPSQLLDTDGEGVYLLHWMEPGADAMPSPMTAAAQLFDDARRWREVEIQTVFMRPSEDGDTWLEARSGWRLSLPPRWRPVAFDYCTPAEGAM